MEKEYKDFNLIAKRGINRFTKMSLANMKLIGEMYRQKTGKNPYNVSFKEDFYKFVYLNTSK
jgi:hypothetical protein